MQFEGELAKKIFNKHKLGRAKKVITSYGWERLVAPLRNLPNHFISLVVKNAAYCIEIWYEDDDIVGTPLYGSFFYIHISPPYGMNKNVEVKNGVQTDRWIVSYFAETVLQILKMAQKYVTQDGMTCL